MKLIRSAARMLPSNSLICFVAGILCVFIPATTWATENGGSVYPIGVETVLSGFTPPPGRTLLFEFTTFYSANEFADSSGKSAVPEFKLRVFGNALRVNHSWNASVLGGTLESNIAVPFLYEQLHLPSGKFTRFGVGNTALGLLGVGYHWGNLSFFYEADAWLPGPSYSRSQPLNIGQHNFAIGPVGALTYLPDQGKVELSSRIQYILNRQNRDTLYQSGNELTVEYALMRSLSKRIAAGVNGFYYQQTTDDSLNGSSVGNRGRDFAIGPEVRFHLGPLSGFALKYQRDLLVRNRPRGNALWFQICLPLPGRREH